MSFQATILTIFPQIFPGPLDFSLAGRALMRGLWSLNLCDIRQYAADRHRSVDDRPAGGGAGMVMRPDILAAAIDATPHQGPRLLLSPRGEVLSQKLICELAAGPGLMLVCGRFEAIDERVIVKRGLREISLGDFILSGGELAALALLDAIIRLLPGVIGNEHSHQEESFVDGLLEQPHYTTPRLWEGLEIPSILLGGNHRAIAEWKQQERERITQQRRSDLFAAWQQKKR